LSNLVYLIGRLTTDPETIQTENGKIVLDVDLAVQRSYKNVDGVYESDFIKCVLLDGIATKISKYCKKGDLVAIRGQVRTSSYENDKKEKKYSTEIIVDKLSFLSTQHDKNVEKDKDIDIN